MAKESVFQHEVIVDIRRRLPGSIILKNDSSYIQGVPDLLILYENKWAALECKRSASATHRPNQDYYVDRMRSMSYASFIFPENREEVLNELQQSLES